MNTYLLIPIIEVVFCLALLVVLEISGKRHVARRQFSFFLVTMAAWGVFIFMMRSAATLEMALFWEKFVLGAILSSSLFFYRFIMAFSGVRPSRKVMYPIYTIYFTAIGLIPTGLVVSGMQEMWYGKAPIVGPFFALYLLASYAPIARSMMLLARQYRQTRIIDERTRVQYIFVGLGAMFIGATTDYLPALGVNLYPLGIIGNILFCVIATAAMLKYNLLEMKFVLRKGTTYSLTGVLIFGLFGVLIYVLSLLVHDLMSPISLTITVMAVFAAALAFQPVLSRFQHTVDRWFFRERYDHIQLLRSFTRCIRGDLDLEQLADSLVTSVANGMQSRGVYLLIPSPVSGNYSVYASAGQKARGRLQFSVNSPLAAALSQVDNVVDNQEIDAIPSLVGLAESDRRELETNNIELLVPLKSGDNLAGMLLLGSKVSRGPYSNEERSLLHSLSADVASSIENANLFSNMKQKHNELEQAMDGIIHAMSQVVETRDPYTAGHQRRVAELAQAIAEEMGLSEWQTKGVYIAGLLHDVGKVAVPSEILSKPGKISQYEFSIIKGHSQIGYEILQKIDFPWPVTQAVIQHHERLDGSGYPNAVSGEDIIIEARILGVADVVEAMSSHRPYRPALGLDAALEEISRASGTMYDVEVVDACLRLLKHNQPEFERIMAAAESSHEIVVEKVTGRNKNEIMTRSRG